MARRRTGRGRSLVCGVVLALAGALAAVPAPSAGAASAAEAAPDGCQEPVRPAPQMRVEPCDSPDRIIEKAAKTVPTAAQLAWQQREVTAFTHFG